MYNAGTIASELSWIFILLRKTLFILLVLSPLSIFASALDIDTLIQNELKDKKNIALVSSNQDKVSVLSKIALFAINYNKYDDVNIVPVYLKDQSLHQTISELYQSNIMFFIVDNPIDLFGNSTAELNCFVDSVLESSCTDMYTPVLRSESPRISSSAASFRRGLINTQSFPRGFFILLNGTCTYNNCVSVSDYQTRSMSLMIKYLVESNIKDLLVIHDKTQDLSQIGNVNKVLFKNTKHGLDFVLQELQKLSPRNIFIASKNPTKIIEIINKSSIIQKEINLFGTTNFFLVPEDLLRKFASVSFIGYESSNLKGWRAACLKDLKLECGYQEMMLYDIINLMVYQSKSSKLISNNVLKLQGITGMIEINNGRLVQDLQNIVKNN